MRKADFKMLFYCANKNIKKPAHVKSINKTGTEQD